MHACRRFLSHPQEKSVQSPVVLDPKKVTRNAIRHGKDEIVLNVFKTLPEKYVGLPVRPVMINNMGSMYMMKSLQYYGLVHLKDSKSAEWFIRVLSRSLDIYDELLIDVAYKFSIQDVLMDVCIEIKYTPILKKIFCGTKLSGPKADQLFEKAVKWDTYSILENAHFYIKDNYRVQAIAYGFVEAISQNKIRAIEKMDHVYTLETIDNFNTYILDANRRRGGVRKLNETYLLNSINIICPGPSINDSDTDTESLSEESDSEDLLNRMKELKQSAS